MKKFVALSMFVCSLVISVPGCSGSGPTNVMENVEKSELEKFQEQVAKDEEEMNAAMAGGMDE